MKKNVHYLKTKCSHAHILSKKRQLSKKTLLSYNFFQIFHENPQTCQTHIWSKKRQFCENYTILWAKKVKRMPFFSDLSRKITSLMPIFCKKKVNFLKNTMLSCPYFVKKNVHPLKNTMLSCHFLQICHEKTLAVMPIFGQKSVDSVKTKLYYGLKKSIRYPFFLFFTKQTLL